MTNRKYFDCLWFIFIMIIMRFTGCVLSKNLFLSFFFSPLACKISIFIIKYLYIVVYIARANLVIMYIGVISIHINVFRLLTFFFSLLLYMFLSSIYVNAIVCCSREELLWSPARTIIISIWMREQKLTRAMSNYKVNALCDLNVYARYPIIFYCIRSVKIVVFFLLFEYIIIVLCLYI